MKNHELIHRLTTGAHLTPKVQMDAADEIIRLEAENAALQEWQNFALAALGVLRDGMPPAEVEAVQRFIAATRTEGRSQGDGYYAVALHPDGTSTDLKKPYCRDCGSNDVSMEGKS